MNAPDFKNLKEAWTCYLDIVIPDDAGSVQIEETRRGFYAGGLAAMAVLSDLLVDHQDDYPDNKITGLLMDELQEFADNLPREKDSTCENCEPDKGNPFAYH